MKSFRNLLLIAACGFILFGCKKDVYDMNKLSDGTGITRKLYFPLIKGIIEFDKLLNIEYDSIAFLGGDTIKFYFDLEIEHADTIKLSSSSDGNITVHYATLHYWLKNSFPLGLDLTLLMYDSIQQRVIDTIPLNNTPGIPFLEAPDMNDDGTVDFNSVVEKPGDIEITSQMAIDLLQNTTHLIINSNLMISAFSTVQIYDNSKLDIQLVFDGEVTIK